jgi:hypothetical protein
MRMRAGARTDVEHRARLPAGVHTTAFSQNQPRQGVPVAVFRDSRANCQKARAAIGAPVNGRVRAGARPGLFAIRRIVALPEIRRRNHNRWRRASTAGTSGTPGLKRSGDE